MLTRHQPNQKFRTRSRSHRHRAAVIAIAMVWPLLVAVPYAAAAPLARPVIAGGYGHSLAIGPGGTVWAWGNNGSGRLGDGTTTNRSPPVQVSGLTGVTAITGGTSHSLAVKTDGTVWAWGNNFNGRLGDGTTTNRSTPVQVSGLTGVTAIAAGLSHSLAVKTDGTVWAWGYNLYGQLGDSTTTTRTTPVQVVGLTGITAIAAGLSHSLAVKTDGTVWAWGANGDGQLGDGTTTTRTTPVQTRFPSSNPAPGNAPPSVPSLISPASGASLPGPGPHTFTITATDADGDNWHGQIDIADTSGVPHSTLLTGEAASGANASATAPVALPSGAYQWRARAIDARGAVGDYSDWRAFTVGSGAAVPVPSEDCAGGTTVADGYGGGSYVRVRAHQPDPSTLWVCVRADGASVGHGGRFTLSTAGTALPNTPTTDTDWEACTVTPGDIDALPDPVYDATIAGSVHVRFDAYQSTTEFWTCVKVGNEARYRVKVPLAPGGGTPTVTFLPDPPDAGPPVPSDSPVYASGDCARASSGTRTEWLNGDIANSHVWLSSWAESTSRGHVCVRLEGGGNVGGKLTLDTTLNPGISPVVDGTTSAGKPTECSQPLYEQASPSELRLFVTPAGANPAGVCIKRDGVDWQMIRLGASGSPNVSMPVAWTPDPGTPG